MKGFYLRILLSLFVGILAWNAGTFGIWLLNSESPVWGLGIVVLSVTAIALLHAAARLWLPLVNPPSKDTTE